MNVPLVILKCVSTERLRKYAAVTLVIALVGVTRPCLAQSPETAVAAPSAADKALEFARKGAGHFKAKEFLEAARSFEAAYRANPKDLRNLRYAGRAWEEVGALDRAMSLLERYAQLETNPKFKASIEPRVAKLKAMTPRQRVDALVVASGRFPQGKLEIDAARALMRLGTKSDLERALKLYETARIWAVDAGLRAQVEGAIDATRNRIRELENKAKQPVVVKPVAPAPVVKVVPAPPVPSAPAGNVALYVVGGVLGLAGAGALVVGLSETQSANDAWQKDQSLTVDLATYKTFDEYKQAYSQWQRIHLAGLVAAGVGGAALVVAILRSVTSGGATNVSLLPTLHPNGGSVSVQGSF